VETSIEEQYMAMVVVLSNCFSERPEVKSVRYSLFYISIKFQVRCQSIKKSILTQSRFMPSCRFSQANHLTPLSHI
jgi:hypothetical protein